MKTVDAFHHLVESLKAQLYSHDIKKKLFLELMYIKVLTIHTSNF